MDPKTDIGALLAAEAFDACAVERLASRVNYASAAQTLLREISARDKKNLVSALLDRGSLSFPYRLAVRFGLIRLDDDYPTITLDWLRERSASKALALAGEIDWPSANREVRACFALQALVHAMRGLS